MTISGQKETETTINGFKVRVDKTVTFGVGVEKGNPTLSNIKGLGVHFGLWLDVQKVSVGPHGSGKAVFIQAGKGLVHHTEPVPLE